MRKLTKQEIQTLKSGGVLVFEFENYAQKRYEIDWNELCDAIGIDPDSFVGIIPTPIVSDWGDDYIHISCYP